MHQPKATTAALRIHSLWPTILCVSLALSGCLEDIERVKKNEAGPTESGQTQPDSSSPTNLGPGSNTSTPTNSDETSSSTKMPPKGCQSDGDCEQGRHCSDHPSSPGKRICVACTEDNHCGGELGYCWPGTVNAQPACAACRGDNGAGCGPQERCLQPDPNQPPVCGECSQDSDCSGNEHCWAAPGGQRKCVECTSDAHCSGTLRPRCNLMATPEPECAPCNQIEGQCGDGQICFFWGDNDGRCSQTLLYVKSSDNMCDSANGSMSRPFCDIADALAAVDAKVPTTIRLLSDDNTGLGLPIDSGTNVAIVGQGHKMIAQLAPTDNIFVVLHDIRYESDIRGEAGNKWRLSDLQLGRFSTISTNGGDIRGERVQQKGQTLPQSTALIDVDSGSVRLSSSVFASNSLPTADEATENTPIFSVRGTGKLELDHVSVVDNRADQARPLFGCSGNAAEITLRSNFILDFSARPVTTCSEAQLRAFNSVSDKYQLAGKDGRTFINQEWKSLFRNPNAMDFAWKDGFGDSPEVNPISIRSVGQWRPGDSPTDIDGNPWNPKSTYVGADQSK